MNKYAWSAVLCLLVSACGQGVTLSPAPKPSPAPTAAVQHLYLGDDQDSGLLRAYALPLTSASTPLASVPVNGVLYLGSNATSLAVTDRNDTSVSIYALPLSSSSAPEAVVSANPNDPLFLPGGTLALADEGGNIDLYSPPFSNASAPSGSIQTNGFGAKYLANGPSGSIFADDSANTIAAISGGAVTTLVTAASGTQYRGLAATPSQLFACGFTNNGPAYFVDVYALPLTASSAPAFRITNGLTSDEACAVDASGNLYVGQISGMLDVYEPPFSSSSSPVVAVSTGAVIFGMAIGQ